MKQPIKKTHGFTLVEMIVVIAIIAILAAVIIPTTAGFIDRARLSNDRQAAASMTQALRSAAILGEVEGSLDAFEAREAINAFAEGEGFTFETTARNTGFFFIPASSPENNRIIALKFSDAEGIPQGELFNDAFETRLFNLIKPQPVSAFSVLDAETPEQLFGNDRILLTYSGSLVAEVVWAIRNSANPDFIEFLSDPSLLERLARGTAGLERAKALYFDDNGLEAPFSPKRAIYISNATWYGNTEGGAIQRVIFAPGISNLPNIPDLNGVPLTLPRTIRSTTMEESRVTEIFGSALTHVVAVDKETLPQWSGITASVSQADLVEGVPTPREVVFDLSELENRSLVTGYDVIINGRNVTVFIFTAEGLTARADLTVDVFVADEIVDPND